MKKKGLISYEDLEIEEMYKKKPKKLMNHMKKLKDDDKERIIGILYDSEHENPEVISWIDKNEPKLIRDIGLKSI